MSNREVRYKSRVRIDYSGKNLENPFHKTNRGLKRDEFSLRLKMAFILFLVLVLAFLYFMFFSSVFDIKKVQIDGLSRTNSTDIEKMVWEQSNENRYWLFKQSNLLIFDDSTLTQSLIDNYHFREVKIKKSIFHTLKINLIEREYSYIWQEKDKYYYIDNDGYLIDELTVDLPPVLINTNPATTSTSTEIVSTTTAPLIEDYFKMTIESARTISGNNYPIIINMGEEHFKGNLVDIDKSYLDFTREFSDKIKANNEPELAARYFMIDKDFNTIKTILNGGLTVYFSTKEEAESQIRNLLVLKKELKGDFNKIIKKKIDLRYGDKVYYE